MRLPKHRVAAQIQPKESKKIIAKAMTFFLAPQVGLEPTTLRLTAACSTG
jgi:hypothetical protein